MDNLTTSRKWRRRPESAAGVNASLSLHVKRICLGERRCWPSWDSGGRSTSPAGRSRDGWASELHPLYLTLPPFVSWLLCLGPAGTMAVSKPFTPLSLFTFQKKRKTNLIIERKALGLHQAGLSDRFIVSTATLGSRSSLSARLCSTVPGGTAEPPGTVGPGRRCRKEMVGDGLVGDAGIPPGPASGVLLKLLHQFPDLRLGSSRGLISRSSCWTLNKPHACAGLPPV